jgi:hypothetical protein
VLLQVKVALLPLTTVAGEFSVTVGAGVETTELDALLVEVLLEELAAAVGVPDSSVVLHPVREKSAAPKIKVTPHLLNKPLDFAPTIPDLLTTIRVVATLLDQFRKR